MVTRKRKGGKITNKTRRNIERRLRNVDMSQESINASRRVLTKQQQIASEALDRAVEKTAQGIRIGSKALAKVAQDPEAMKSLAETIEAVGSPRKDLRRRIYFPWVSAPIRETARNCCRD